MSERIPVRRLVAEGVVVVASILLAFGIDAWWSDRVEREEERRALAALHEELEADAELLEATLAFHTEVEASAVLLLEAAAGQLDLTSDSLIHLLSDLSWWRSTNLQTGALDAILLGGALPLLENDSLRRELAGWRQTVEEFAELEAQDYTTYADVWMPFLRDRASMPAIANSLRNYPGAAPDEYNFKPVASRPPRDHRGILSDPAFANVVLQKRWVQQDVLSRVNRVVDRLAGLIELVESELSRWGTI